MSALAQALKAVYTFLVGDMRILIGTIVTLVVTGLVARVSPVWAGVEFFVLLAITLALSLRHETQA